MQILQIFGLSDCSKSDELILNSNTPADNLKYSNESNVILFFGIMNEPHNIPDMAVWAATVQAAVYCNSTSWGHNPADTFTR